MVEIKIITIPSQKTEICNTILRALPDWFGIESAIVEYVSQSQTMPFWVAVDSEQPIGLIALKQHNAYTAEIFVMAILANYHRHGIGRQLLEYVGHYCKEHRIEYLTVKTLAEENSNPYYTKTRGFYLKMGFRPLEVFPTLWDKANPCLLLAKYLA